MALLQRQDKVEAQIAGHCDHHGLLDSEVHRIHQNVKTDFKEKFTLISDKGNGLKVFSTTKSGRVIYYLFKKIDSNDTLKYPIRSILSFIASKLSPGTVNILSWEISLSKEEKIAISNQISDETQKNFFENNNILVYTTDEFNTEISSLSAQDKNNFALCISHAIRCIHMEGFKIRNLDFKYIGFKEAADNLHDFFIYYLDNPSGVMDDIGSQTRVINTKTKFSGTYAQDVYDFARMVYALFLEVYDIDKVDQRVISNFLKQRPEGMTDALYNLLFTIFNAPIDDCVPSSYQIFQMICSSQLFYDKESLESYNARVAQIQEADTKVQKHQNITLTTKIFNEIQSPDNYQRLKAHVRIAYGTEMESFEALSYAVMVFENGCGGVNNDFVRAFMMRRIIEQKFGYKLAEPAKQNYQKALMECFKAEAEARQHLQMLHKAQLETFYSKKLLESHIDSEKLSNMTDEERARAIFNEEETFIEGQKDSKAVSEYQLRRKVRNEIAEVIDKYAGVVRTGSAARRLLNITGEIKKEDYEEMKKLAIDAGFTGWEGTSGKQFQVEDRFVLDKLVSDSVVAFGRIGPLVLILDPKKRDYAEELMRNAIKASEFEKLHYFIKNGFKIPEVDLGMEEAACIVEAKNSPNGFPTIDPLYRRIREKPYKYEYTANLVDIIHANMDTYTRLALARLLEDKYSEMEEDPEEAYAALSAHMKPKRLELIEEIANLYRDCILANFFEHRSAEKAFDYYYLGIRYCGGIAKRLLQKKDEGSKRGAEFALEIAHEFTLEARNVIEYAVKVDEERGRSNAIAKKEAIEALIQIYNVLKTD